MLLSTFEVISSKSLSLIEPNSVLGPSGLDPEASPCPFLLVFLLEVTEDMFVSHFGMSHQEQLKALKENDNWHVQQANGAHFWNIDDNGNFNNYDCGLME